MTKIVMLTAIKVSALHLISEINDEAIGRIFFPSTNFLPKTKNQRIVRNDHIVDGVGFIDFSSVCVSRPSIRPCVMRYEYMGVAYRR